MTKFLFLGCDSYLYGLGSDFCVYRIIEPNGSWSKFINGTVTKIIVHEDIIYGIGKDDHAVYQTSTTTGGSWTKVANAYVTDLAYSNGYLYGVGTDLYVYRTVPNGSWSRFTDHSITRIIIHGDYIYGIGKDNDQVWKTSAIFGGSWKMVAGCCDYCCCCTTDLAAHSNGYLFGVKSDLHVYRTLPNNGSWSQFTDGNVTNIIIDGDDIYGIGYDNAVYKTSVTFGGSWTKVVPYVIDLLMITTIQTGKRLRNDRYFCFIKNIVNRIPIFWQNL